MFKIVFLMGLFAFYSHAESVESLEERIEKLEDKVNAPQLRSNLFNPGMTVFGNSFVCGGKGCERPFTLREIELDLRASIDPWADGVVILAFEPHGEHAAVEIEEGYVVLKKLPILDDAPLGLTLKIGHYLQPFGRFNQIHTHDLPQINQPAAVKAFLYGDGHAHTFGRTGISAEFFIPTPGETNSLRLNLNLINGGGLGFEQIQKSQIPAGLAHMTWFWDLALEHDLEVGLSTYLENNPGKALLQLYGTDINYKWRPYKQGEKKSLLIGGEFFVANGKKGNAGYWPLGGFVWTHYQINQWFYPGLRYSYYQGVGKQDNPNHSIGAFLTYYTTEFLRLRAGYEWDNYNQNKVLLEINFVMGSHPVEPYWVNR